MPWVFEFAREFGGLTAIGIALVAVLKDIWTSRLLEKERTRREGDIERLKGQLDAQRQQVQYELDLRLHSRGMLAERHVRHLSEIWEAVCEFGKAALALRPGSQLLRKDESPGQRIARKFNEFQTARDRMIDVFERARPFYSPAVYKALTPVVEKADEEAWMTVLYGESMHMAGEDPEKALEEGLRNVEDLTRSIDGLCEIIRKEVSG